MDQDQHFFDLDQSSLSWLQGWYMSRCDGDWEHTWGVRIDTLDNPGWTVRIDVAETNLESRPFDRFEYQRDEHDWLRLWVWSWLP